MDLNRKRFFRERLGTTLSTPSWAARLDQMIRFTLLTGVEHFVINRPLTVVSSDSGHIEPLTPNHFC